MHKSLKLSQRSSIDAKLTIQVELETLEQGESKYKQRHSKVLRSGQSQVSLKH